MRQGFSAIGILLTLMIATFIFVFITKSLLNVNVINDNSGVSNIEQHVNNEVKKIEEIKKIQSDYFNQTVDY